MCFCLNTILVLDGQTDGIGKTISRSASDNNVKPRLSNLYLDFAVVKPIQVSPKSY